MAQGSATPTIVAGSMASKFAVEREDACLSMVEGQVIAKPLLSTKVTVLTKFTHMPVATLSTSESTQLMEELSPSPTGLQQDLFPDPLTDMTLALDALPASVEDTPPTVSSRWVTTTALTTRLVKFTQLLTSGSKLSKLIKLQV